MREFLAVLLLVAVVAVFKNLDKLSAGRLKTLNWKSLAKIGSVLGIWLIVVLVWKTFWPDTLNRFWVTLKWPIVLAHIVVVLFAVENSSKVGHIREKVSAFFSVLITAMAILALAGVVVLCVVKILGGPNIFQGKSIMHDYGHQQPSFPAPVRTGTWVVVAPVGGWSEVVNCPTGYGGTFYGPTNEPGKFAVSNGEKVVIDSPTASIIGERIRFQSLVSTSVMVTVTVRKK